MLNNNPNPLRAAYPELDGRTAMEALQSPAIAGAAAGLPVFTGPGGVAETRTAEEALAALGLPYEVGTWTPEKIGGNYNGGISSYSDCNYLRLGRLLYASCKLILSAAQSTDCYMQIRGLPFYINPVAMGWTVISNTAYSGQGNAIYTTGNLYFTDGVPVDGATIYYGMVGIMRG